MLHTSSICLDVYIFKLRIHCLALKNPSVENLQHPADVKVLDKLIHRIIGAKLSEYTVVNRPIPPYSHFETQGVLYGGLYGSS